MDDGARHGQHGKHRTHDNRARAHAVNHCRRREILRCNTDQSLAHLWAPFGVESGTGVVGVVTAGDLIDVSGILIPSSAGLVNLSRSAAATSLSCAFWLNCNARM